MQVIRDFDHVQLPGPTVLTIGTFDGLHRGHQDVIRQLNQAARHHQADTAVIAFHPRPKAVFAPDRFKDDYLTTPQERIRLFQEMNIDVLILIPFSLTFAQTTAHDFVKQLSERLSLAQICVGHDFALGKNREGNISKLRELGKTFDYSVCEIEAFTLDGSIVSSTEIRACLRAGNVRRAAYLLGRYPFLTSQVIQGAKRGRTIGFPTANLAIPAERLLPANGVYATLVQFSDSSQRYPSVTNVGVRPSFGGVTPTVEAHVFGFNRDIYGQEVILSFVERLRPEKKFAGIESLVAQIERDAKQAKALLDDELGD